VASVKAGKGQFAGMRPSEDGLRPSGRPETLLHITPPPLISSTSVCGRSTATNPPLESYLAMLDRAGGYALPPAAYPVLSCRRERRSFMEFNAITSVTTGLTLVAFLIATFATVFRRRLKHTETLIRDSPAKDRARLIEQVVDAVHVDTSGLTRDQRFQLALKTLNTRAEHLRMTRWITLSFGLIAGFLTLVAILPKREAVEHVVPSRSAQPSTASETTGTPGKPPARLSDTQSPSTDKHVRVSPAVEKSPATTTMSHQQASDIKPHDETSSTASLALESADAPPLSNHATSTAESRVLESAGTSPVPKDKNPPVPPRLAIQNGDADTTVMPAISKAHVYFTNIGSQKDATTRVNVTLFSPSKESLATAEVANVHFSSRRTVPLDLTVNKRAPYVLEKAAYILRVQITTTKDEWVFAPQVILEWPNGDVSTHSFKQVRVNERLPLVTLAEELALRKVE